MAGKRGAANQITYDNFVKGYEDDEEAPGAMMKASDEVLATRKILKPKRRIDDRNISNNGFKGFGSVPASTQPSNPFVPANVKHAKIIALNSQFVNTINKLNTPNSLVDYTAIAEKYIKYYKSIHEDSNSSVTQPTVTNEEPKSAFSFKKPVHTPVVGISSSLFSSQPKPAPSTTGVEQFNAPTTTSFKFEPKPQSQSSFTFTAGFSKPPAPTPKFVFAPATKPEESSTIQPEDISVEMESDSENEAKPEIKVQGPQFTLSAKPTTKSSPFTFDPKKLAKINAPDSDDSDDEVVVKGPTFQFNKPIVDSVFKLGKETDNSKDNTDKPAISFGSTSDKPVFTFNVPDKKEDKPVIPFSSIDEKKENKPTFKFTVPDKKDDKPTFGFGSTNEKKDDKPAFVFGLNSEKKDDKPTVFSFKSDKKDENPFTSSQTTDKPSFTFNPSTNKDFVNPFSSAGTNNNNTEKPTSLFGSKDNNKSALSFGSSNITTNTDSTEEKKEEKPTSLFGAKPASFSNEAPKFNFGGATSSLTKITSDDKSEAGEETKKPVFNFVFNPSKTENPFGGASSNIGSSAGTATTEGDDDKVTGEETGGDFAPVAQLSSDKIENVATGEEDEELIYTKRCKLMELDTSNTENPYTNKGVGDLKVLKHKETQKARILMRADGGLRILLNTLISKGIKYETMGNGSLVRIPTFDSSGKIVTYVVKVKTAVDGSELLKAITDVQ